MTCTYRSETGSSSRDRTASIGFFKKLSVFKDNLPLSDINLLFSNLLRQHCDRVINPYKPSVLLVGNRQTVNAKPDQTLTQKFLE